MTDVKICGLKTPEAVRAAAAAGADWIGFVLVAASPRHVSLGQAAALITECGAARPAALLVDPEDALADQAVDAGVHALQLHGAETPERVAALKMRYAEVEIWKALGVAAPVDLEAAAAYSGADRLLIDARPPKDADRTGGHGRSFDWSILEGWRASKPWFLAGGLTPQNVAAAIHATGAPAVDVSSGVERAPGVKDIALIERFITAAKAVR